MNKPVANWHPDWYSDAAEGDAGDDDDLVWDTGIPSWERRLTPRGKLRRGAFAVASLIALAVVLLGGPATVARLLTQSAPAVSRLSAAPPGNLGWQHFDAPASAAANPQIRIAPANGPSALAYACWINLPRRALGVQVGPLQLALYNPATSVANPWSDLRGPAPNAFGCDIRSDTVIEDSAILVVKNISINSDTCPPPALYATTDRGANWRPILWPSSVLSTCDLGFALVAKRLYIYANTPLLAASQLPAGAAGRILTTSDFGATWRAADIGIDSASDLTVLGFRPDGGILAQTARSGVLNENLLWQSWDSGLTWQVLASLPGTSPRVLLSSAPRDVATLGWGRIYLLTSVVTGSGATKLTTTAIATATLPPSWMVHPFGAPALRWTPVPPAPAGNIFTGGRPWGTSLADASEGPGGSLLYLRSATASTPNIILPEFHIWYWDTAGHTWAQLPYTIPPNATIQGAAWNSGHLSIWVTLFGGGLTARVRVQTNIISLAPAR
ncbi:MAG: hypothetical protein OJF49_000335 [Ktedonobacterales bacterium]|jgi:hypothetical protein|nr:MAG: hypothetical protein OJF49_000335 [Ktedonobacterales bacterium]